MEIQKHFRLACGIVDLLYNRIAIGKYRVGLYSLVALTPGIGDMLSGVLAIYILWISAQMQLPTRARIQMIWNIILDLSFGSIPLAGDIADTVFRAHVRNIDILRKYAKPYPSVVTSF